MLILVHLMTFIASGTLVGLGFPRKPQVSYTAGSRQQAGGMGFQLEKTKPVTHSEPITLHYGKGRRLFFSLKPDLFIAEVLVLVRSFRDQSFDCLNFQEN